MIPNKNILKIVLVLVVLGILARVFSDIFIYIVISLVISAILAPVVNYISGIYFFKIKIPRIAAVFFSFIILLSVLFSFIIIFTPLISEQIKLLRGLEYNEVHSSFTNVSNNIEAFLNDNFHINKEKGFLQEEIKKSIFGFLERFELGSAINEVISITGAAIVGTLAVVFITFFFLYEKGIVRNLIISMIPNQYFEVLITAIYKIEKLLSNYLLGLMLQIIAVFSIATFGLSLLGIKYAITIALFAALINLVPYLGPPAGALFGILVGISTSHEPNNLLLIIKIVIVFAIVQFVDNFLLQPIIFSKSVKAHPLEIFLAIFAGATIAGPIGMIVAIPGYTILRVSVRELLIGYRQYHIFKN